MNYAPVTSTVVSLSVFSGRPNPTSKLSEEQDRELRKLLARLSVRETARMFQVRRFGLGVFRINLSREQGADSLEVGGGIVDCHRWPFAFKDTAGVGSYLLDIFADSSLQERTMGAVREYFFKKHPPMRTPAAQCIPSMTPDATPYDNYWGATITPDGMVWNRQPCNNCYNYANQQLTDDYAQPGAGGGQMYTTLNCDTLTAAAIRDGLIKVPNSAIAHPLLPGQGWYVALWFGNVAGDPDYHWLKQDDTGCWSHKLGNNMPYDRDFQGHKITIAHQAALVDSFHQWKYGRFCGYFITNKNVTIAGNEVNSCYPAF